MQINKIFKDGIGLGGIFHSAIQVYGDQEWSFGFCEQGPGVFSCPSKKNPMYTYRESIKLGETSFSVYKVNQILRDLRREWPGYSYDLLAKNCNHFCDEFCEKLGVSKLPGWVNRFAHAGDTAAEIAGNTAYRFRQAKTEIVTASKVAYRFLAGVASNNSNTATNSSSPGGDSNGSSPGCQAGWLKNFILPGAKPSSSLELENPDQDLINQKQRQDAQTAPRSNSEKRDI
ncbi:desi-like protein at4g17486 [Phtheirospermum japonicum]|uniref:Desi-like protein at4g17486 n=1 Tax=Phtheirospermum japonicum TaxID=374723 RepID=A0A830D3I0_9LAMI|nr:desi-like protein at4g17486 [Phtheirospermum japonicum]